MPLPVFHSSVIFPPLRRCKALPGAYLALFYQVFNISARADKRQRAACMDTDSPLGIF